MTQFFLLYFVNVEFTSLKHPAHRQVDSVECDILEKFDHFLLHEQGSALTVGLCPCSSSGVNDVNVGCIDKWVISKTTNLTTPELFIGLIQAIWRKNEHICLKKTPGTLQKTALLALNQRLTGRN